jgi:alpha-galactosidase
VAPRINGTWQRVCLSIVLLATTLSAAPAETAGVAKPEEFQQRDHWLKQRFLGDPAILPFSFVFGGKPSQELLASWPRKRTAEKLDDVRTRHTLVCTDPKTGLQLRCVVVEYADLPAVDWVLHLANTGGNDTPIIEQIRPLDATIQGPGKDDFTIHHSLGDSNSARSFAPVTDVLTPAKPGPLVLAPAGGRSSDAHLPYFNIDWHAGGIAAAVGWSGQWEAAFQADANGDLRLRAGQQLTHLKLHPGETIRTPRILLVFWDGNDPLRGNNLFRRTMMAHYMPRSKGELVLPPLCGAVGYADKDGRYDRPHIEAAKPLAERGLEVLWSDMNPQQWYPKGFPEGTGTWEPDPARYPNGLKPVGDAAKAAGIGFLLWFEPERVHPGSKIDREHPEFVMKANGEWSQLFRLHDEKARKWLTDLIDVQITAAQLAWVRWDFNIDPVGFWRRNDAPDRQGMTEIRHIEGLYAMWDDLRARHPGLMIDNCAGGGRRIDIETCSRSLPLWHSDLQCEGPHPVADQLQNGGLFRWVPLHGCANFELDPSYVSRSAMTAGNILLQGCLSGQPSDKDSAKIEAIKRTVAVCKRLRPLMLGDFCPLLPHDESPSQWYGYQFDNPQLKAGCVIAFRREKCSDASKTIRLKGVSPAATYQVTDLDTGKTTAVSGKELLEKGLPLKIATQPGAAIVTYRSKAGG